MSFMGLQVGDIVRLVNPENELEAAARYTVIEHNGDRILMRLHCDLPIPPVELARPGDVVRSSESHQDGPSERARPRPLLP
jgi:hypothetical protein